MSNKDDDLEYYDDDEFYDDDDDELDDDDESITSSRLDRSRSQAKPFSPSGGSGPAGGSRGTSSLPGRGNTPPRYGSGTNRYSPGGGSSSRPEDKSKGNRPAASGAGSRSDRPGSTGASSSRPNSPGGSRPSYSGAGSRSDRPGDSRPASGGSGASRSPFSSGTPRSDKPGDTRPSYSGAGSRSDRPSDSRPASGGSGTSRSPFSSGSRDEKTGNKKDDKSGGKGLGGMRSRLPGSVGGGDKSGKKDKKDNRSSQPRSGDSGGGNALSKGVGGLRSRLPGGAGGGDKKDKKDSRPSQPRSGDSGGGNALSKGVGGLRSRLPGSVGGGDKKDKKGNQPAATSARTSAASRPGSSPGVGSRATTPGQTSQAAGRRGDQKDSKKDAKKDGRAGIGGLASRLPFLGNKSEGKSRSTTTREKLERASKAPKLDESGLTLDNKLDILGVVLLLASLALFFSSMSATKGQLTEAINTGLAQLLGMGAVAVPVVMFAVGIWLIIRHFGDDAPMVDPVRMLGIALLYVSALLIFQFLDTFNPPYTEVNLSHPGQLRAAIELVWSEGRGGGLLGAQLYFTLVTNLGESGMLVIMFGLVLIGSMFMLRLTAAEVAIFFISLWRSFIDSQRRRAETREARTRIAAAELAAAVESKVSVSRPAAAELTEGRSSSALSATNQGSGAPALEEPRPIPITMGGKTVTAFVGGDEASAAANPAGNGAETAAKVAEPSAAGRLFGAIPGLGRAREKVEMQPAEKATPAAKPSKKLSGLFNRGTKEATPAAIAPPAATTPAAAAPITAPTTPPAVTTPAASMTAAATPVAGIHQPASPPAPPRSEPPARIGDLLRSPADRPAPVAPAADKEANGAKFAPPVAEPAQSDEPVQTDDGLKSEEELATMPPATAKGTDPQNVWTRPVAHADEATTTSESLTNRRERLNAIRSGQTAPPTEEPTTGDSVEPGAQKPAAYVPPQHPDTPPGVAATFNGDSTATPAARELTGDQNGQRSADGQPALIARRQTGTTAPMPQKRRDWKLPDYRTLLNTGSETDFDRELLLKRARIIEETLQSFGAPGRVVEVNTGPVITQFGVEPDYLTTRSGKKNRVKVGAIAQLDKDLQLALGAKSIRIEAPVPGRGYVGIEVPNEEASLVSLRDVMESEEFQKTNAKSPLTIGLGLSVDGTPISADLSAMPHLLIAGTTGSGKSVMVNAIITSLLINNRPDIVKIIMVDPKRVELTGYNGIPHLVAPVVVDLERTVGVLKWVTREMDQRYKQFSNASARNIEDFNKHLPDDQEPMPYIVVIIDELADLMMLAPDETERVITRIAALARATGIHLVIATQRPSVDVVTGLIKANFPARIAFAVAGGVDSRVILDQPGAERLLGRGDMLYLSGTTPAPLRLQGVFVSPAEIDNVVRYWKRQSIDQPEPQALRAIVLDESLDQAREVQPQTTNSFAQQAFWDAGDDSGSDSIELHDRVTDERDELYDQAVEMVRRLNKASVSLLQRRLRIGYTRAARLIDMMEAEGIVGPPTEGSKPREVLPIGDTP